MACLHDMLTTALLLLVVKTPPLARETTESEQRRCLGVTGLIYEETERQYIAGERFSTGACPCSVIGWRAVGGVAKGGSAVVL